MIALRWLQPASQDEPVFLALLDEAERTQTLRFRHAEDRLGYAAAHALLRTMLSEAAAVAPGDWRFVTTPSGKPRLDPAAGWSDLRFSLSHTRGMVACAVAPALEVGVDVEPLTRLPDVEGLARTIFSAREAASLETMAEEARSEAFLRLWTLKEAYLKATGEGIGRRMDEPEFDPRHIAGAEAAFLTVRNRGWAFRRFPTPGSFALSLAFPVDEARPTPVRCTGAAIRAGGLYALA